MLSPQICYQKFLQKVNKGNTQFNITCDKARFVILINEAKNSWEKDKLLSKDSILVDDLQSLIAQVDLLVPDKVSTDYVEYKLKEDFFEAITAECEVSREKCKKVIYSREIKNQNRSLFQYDENQSPDFDFEWTMHQIVSGNLRVFKKDFTINKTIFSYYSTVPFFDISGYITIDNTSSTDLPIPIPDRLMDEIINYASIEFMRDFQDSQGITIAKDRT